jgi:hypothetical protein
MSSTYTESTSTSESSSALVRAATYGGMADAIGGIATIVLAIVALAGVHPAIVLSIAVIVFGATLLIQGGTLVSEYESIMFPVGIAGASPEQLGVGGLATLFLVGVAGIVLGILALLGIAPETLTAISVIAFGASLLLSSSSVRNLSMLQAASRSDAPRPGAQRLASEMAAGSASVQMLAGLTAIVLGVLAVSGINQNILMLSALIVLGSSIILTGSALTGLIVGFMRSSSAPSTPRRHPLAP